jgi:hypothetical protein
LGLTHRLLRLEDAEALLVLDAMIAVLQLRLGTAT